MAQVPGAEQEIEGHPVALQDPQPPPDVVADHPAVVGLVVGDVSDAHEERMAAKLGELALEIQGSRGPLARGTDLVPDGGKWQNFALSWPEVVIGGGTPNIQKNIIAERILGLPKDP